MPISAITQLHSAPRPVRQTHRMVAAGQPPPDTAHSCLVPERDWWSPGVRHPNSHLLPSPHICWHCLFKHRRCQGREWMRRICSSRGYNLLLWQKRTAQKDTDSWSDLLFHHPSRLQPKTFIVYCEFEPPLGHFPFLCTANEFNRCKSGRGKGCSRSMTSSGLHLHFWHMCKVHPDYTLFTGDRNPRNCLHHVENAINWLLPRTKFLCQTLWKGHVLPPYAE